MAALTNFQEQFASKVLEKTYQRAVFDAIVNRDYEGEIKKPGDRVNILSFLNAGELGDYAVGTDMTTARVVDTEEQLIVEKRKYYNFALDRLEDLFAYASDIPDHLINEHSMVLERGIDEYVLSTLVGTAGIKAGNWLGIDLVVTGSGQTHASVTTTATGGTVTLSTNVANGGADTGPAPTENPRDGVNYMAGFSSPNDLYKGFRLRSSATFVSPWWRISGITNTMVATLTEWDEAVSGPDFAENYTLRGVFGGDGRTFDRYGTDASLIGMAGLGWEIQAAAPTAITSGVIYEQTTSLAEFLDDGEVPQEDRWVVLPPAGVTMLKQASELQPSGIAEIYTGVVMNGRVGRLGGFQVFSAAGSRVSTRSGHVRTSDYGSDVATTDVVTGYQIPSGNKGLITFADKWSESRVVDAENQFAKKYQGLFLYGARVPLYRRKYGAILFGSV